MSTFKKYLLPSLFLFFILLNCPKVLFAEPMTWCESTEVYIENFNIELSKPYGNADSDLILDFEMCTGYSTGIFQITLPQGFEFKYYGKISPKDFSVTFYSKWGDIFETVDPTSVAMHITKKARKDNDDYEATLFTENRCNLGSIPLGEIYDTNRLNNISVDVTLSSNLIDVNYFKTKDIDASIMTYDVYGSLNSVKPAIFHTPVKMEPTKRIPKYRPRF